MDNYTREEKSVRLQVPICDRVQSTDLTMDVSLPDYQPEIKRLLRVRATVHPADKYIGAGNAEISGVIDYVILYAGNDNALYSAAQTGEYRFTVPMEMTSEYDLSEGILCDVEVRPDMVSGRVVSPRKLSLKCRLRSRTKMYATRILPDAIRTSDQSVQTLRGNTECAHVFLGMSEPIQLADEILLDSQTSDMRVISADGTVFVSEATAGSGTVSCRGEICLKLLTVQDANGTPTVQQRRIPFAQSVNADGAEVNCDCTASGVCTDINVTVEEGRVLCDVTALLRVRAQRNEHVPFLRDVYSTENVTLTQESACTVPKALECMNGNFSLNQTLKLADVGITPSQSMIDLQGTPSVTSLENENGKLYLNGKYRCHAILLGEEDMSAQEFEIPFRYEIGASGAESVSDYSAQVDTILCRARVDGERISVDAELAVSLSVMGEQRFEMISEAKFGEKVGRSASVYTVCYPSPDDSLWSVAKRYHRPVSAIADINGLGGAASADSTESLAGVTYLLV